MLLCDMEIIPPSSVYLLIDRVLNSAYPQSYELRFIIMFISMQRCYISLHLQIEYLNNCFVQNKLKFTMKPIFHLCVSNYTFAIVCNMWTRINYLWYLCQIYLFTCIYCYTCWRNQVDKLFIVVILWLCVVIRFRLFRSMYYMKLRK